MAVNAAVGVIHEETFVFSDFLQLVWKISAPY